MLIYIGMNFKSNISDIKNKLLKLENKRTSHKGKLKDTFHKGVYVISQFENQDSYKIGLARGTSGLYQRIKSYAIGYPYSDELFVHFMIICLSATDAEKFEKIILADTALNQVEQNPSKGSLEWRINSKYNTIQNSITKACLDYPNLWQKIIVFGKNGWEVVHNDVTKKYTRSTFKLEKPSDDYTGKTNVYGTTEFIAHKNPKVIKEVKKNTIPISKPTSRADNYSENIVGRTVLFKWDSTKPTDPRGWFKGRVLAKKTTKLEKSKGFNYNVKYTKKDTQGLINGNVASQLIKSTYGTKWFILKDN
jgi:hypothetical protein